MSANHEMFALEAETPMGFTFRVARNIRRSTSGVGGRLTRPAFQQFFRFAELPSRLLKQNAGALEKGARSPDALFGLLEYHAIESQPLFPAVGTQQVRCSFACPQAEQSTMEAFGRFCLLFLSCCKAVSF
jgi:hypothetical protein